MSRYPLFALSLLFGMATSSYAQDPTVLTRVYTDPNGLRFFVDGQSYKSAQAFLWPVGSKHTIFIETEQQIFSGTRSKFTGWSDSTNTLNASSESITITADATISYIKASFQTEHLLRVQFYSCNQTNPLDCHPPGTVMVGGAPSTVDIEQWFSDGTSVTLQAFPNPGFVFVGWGPPSNYSTSFLYNYIIKQPTTFSNIFQAAKRVTLLSDPPALLVAPDRTPTKSPADMDWAQGSKHVLGAVSPQGEAFDAGRLWVFKQWSNGAQLNDLYTVNQTNISETLTATFVRGARASFVTNPTGLKVKIDGRDNWPAYNFVWGVGMKYQISAPAEQLDSKGRKWVFKGWSNGGPAAQEITITDSDVTNGFRLIANFEAQNRVTISTNPPGLPIEVDGQECRGSCTVERAEGAQILLKAPTALPLSDNTRFEFTGWSDGGSASHAYIFSANSDTTITANFRSLFKLITIAEPAGGTAFRLDPPAADGFYASDASVTVTADVKQGFRFRRWDGDLSGTFKAGLVSMNVPRIVRALLDVSPFVEDSGVRNAAGETPENLVAPGSIGSIFGVNLAGGYEVGPSNPLAQTIGGVTVRLQSRLLPLVFVSSEQINLQVPSDLAEGLYQVAVKWDNYPEVNSAMRVVRNAPGLFQKKVEDRLFATATREDGSEVLPGAPASKGEVIAVFGTGFGPYERRIPDGFPLPANPSYPLMDTLEVFAGDAPVEVLWAGGVPGQIGTAMVRFRLPDDFTPVDGGLQIRVRVNGRESNTAKLAVQ